MSDTATDLPRAISAETAQIRKPLVTEVPYVAAMIAEAAARQELLPRSEDEIIETIRDFHVYSDGQGIGGCCALHVDMDNLAEVRSLIVREDLRHAGIGTLLIEACFKEAQGLQLARIYALTRVPAFFQRLGFHIIQKNDLPQKVFKDCIRCALFFNCDEIAVARDIVSGAPFLPPGRALI